MARLPQPGSDVNTWGAILNDYLRQQHFANGLHDVSAILSVPSLTGQFLVSDPMATNGITWHPLSKSTVGLAQADNTSDADKPVSIAQAAVINQKISKNDAIALAVAL
jgi:hypothetical protein